MYSCLRLFECDSSLFSADKATELYRKLDEDEDDKLNEVINFNLHIYRIKLRTNWALTYFEKQSTACMGSEAIPFHLTISLSLVIKCSKKISLVANLLFIFANFANSPFCRYDDDNNNSNNI